MRRPIERTSTITIEMYSLLWDICERYYENLAWKFPEPCPDGFACCGLDMEKFSSSLRFEIPNLFRDSNGMLSKPSQHLNSWDGSQEFDQYALLDFIELIAINCRDISSRTWHSYFRHDDLEFEDDSCYESGGKFRSEINEAFERMGLQYHMQDGGYIQRVTGNDYIIKEASAVAKAIKEGGTRELLKEALELYCNYDQVARRDSVEKIWDALERLKTYYTDLDKKASAGKIIADMSQGDETFEQLYNDEFFALTNIGNKFRIRHHETDKVDIRDARHYDYFFNRCLALIITAAQYLK